MVCIAALFCIAAAISQLELPEVKLTVLVVDENHKPLGDADVRISFLGRLTHQDMTVRGKTDSAGLFTAAGGASIAGIGCIITKNGYYWGTPLLPRFTELDPVLNHWKPWNETYTAVLRPIINPVVGYAKNSWILIPEVQKPCGYDLTVGDWVSPWGKGKIADLIFTLNRDYKSAQSFRVRMDLGFSNPLDGIKEVQLSEEFAGSDFIWDRKAPDGVYIHGLNSEFNNSIGGSFQQTTREDQNFYLRIRAIEQNGKIIEALYGKIQGGFQLAPSDSKTCKVHLNYYLNPISLDQNMEFNPSDNLLKGLQFSEQPKKP